MNETVETVRVTVTDEDGQRSTVDLGAHNRSEDEVRNLVAEHFNRYAIRSEREGEKFSLADFTLFLIAESAVEHKRWEMGK